MGKRKCLKTGVPAGVNREMGGVMQAEIEETCDSGHAESYDPRKGLKFYTKNNVTVLNCFKQGSVIIWSLFKICSWAARGGYVREDRIRSLVGGIATNQAKDAKV